METFVIEATKREQTKKEANKRYRRDGLIPSIIYGQGRNINILIDNKKFYKMSSKLTKSTIINLKVQGDKDYDVLIKDYDKDYIKDRYLHLDFYELDKNKPVHFRVPLNLIGNALGIREGGILEKHLVQLEIECLPKDIVPHFDINIEHLKMNESLHVNDIKLDSKYKILSHKEEVVVHISGKLADEEETKKEGIVEEAATTAEATASETKAKEEEK